MHEPTLTEHAARFVFDNFSTLSAIAIIAAGAYLCYTDEANTWTSEGHPSQDPRPEKRPQRYD